MAADECMVGGAWLRYERSFWCQPPCIWKHLSKVQVEQLCDSARAVVFGKCDFHSVLMSVICNHALAGLIVRIAVRNSKCKRQRSWICWGFRRNNSSCIDSTASIIGHRRRRPRCPEHMPFLFCYFPAWWCGGNFLKGGGPKKSQSGKQVTEVAQCLKQLTQADGAVQAQLSVDMTSRLRPLPKCQEESEENRNRFPNQVHSPHCGTL